MGAEIESGIFGIWRNLPNAVTRPPRHSPLVPKVWQVGEEEEEEGGGAMLRGRDSADSADVCFDYVQRFQESVARLLTLID